MPKKKAEKPQREVTRRQLSHWQRENRLQRIVMIAGLVVVLSIFVVVGTGLYMNKFRPLNAVVVKAGGTEYNMDYFINMLAFYGRTMDPQYLPYFTDSVAQQIARNKIFTDEAAKPPIGITVTDAEIDAAIKEQELTNDKTRRDAVRAELLHKKLTDEYFDKIVPASGEQRQVWAMLLESNSQLEAIAGRINSGEKFADIAAELSLDPATKEKKGDLGWLPKGVLPLVIGSGQLLEDRIFQSDFPIDNLNAVDDAEVYKYVGYWLFKVTETNAETAEAHVFAMLLPSEEQALVIKAKLDAGEDFVTLAKANSLWTGAAENGGDLGFIKAGTLSDAADAVLFPEDTAQSLPLNQVSGPVQDTEQYTRGGVWLVQLIAVNPDMAIEGDNRTLLVNNALIEWQNQTWEENQSNYEILLTDEQKAYAVQEAMNR